MTWILKLSSPSDPSRLRYFGKHTFPVSDALHAMAFDSKADAEQMIYDLRHSGFAHLLTPTEVPPRSGLAFLMSVQKNLASKK